MILTLVRHGDALPARPGEPDGARSLSERGRREALTAARFLLYREASLERILTSPLRRAVETATPIAEAFGRRPEPVPWLASGARPDDLAQELTTIEVLRVALVGHAPDLGLLASYLSGGVSAAEVTVGKGGIALLEVSPPFSPGQGTLRRVFDAAEIARLAPPE